MYEIFWYQIETNGTKKILFFPHNIQYRERLKRPPFNFFSTVVFFEKCFQQCVPFHFFDVLQQWTLKNADGSQARKFGRFS